MLTPNVEYIKELKKAVNKSPFPHHLSMRMAHIDLDQATIELTLSKDHLQLYGIAHGGVYATLIDTATFWAVFMRLPEEAGLVSIDLKLNYLKAAKNGVLIAEGRCIRGGRSISYAEASVRNPEGELFAHGTSTLKALPGKGMRLTARKFLA